MNTRRTILVALLAAGTLGGCAARDRVAQRVEAAALRAEYGVAREELQKSLADDSSDKAYLLDRMRLLILTLADGQPEAAELTANELYDLLRRQGLNADRTAASTIFNERVRIWKGEPFEQAMAYTYIGIQKAMVGEWDNARAAAQSSLFLLRDFGENERGERTTAEDLARQAALVEQRGGDGDAVIDRGYTPVKTNFTLGYLLNGVANVALGRAEEALDNFAEAERLDPSLRPLCDVLRGGGYNTILVVDYGRGPTKQAYGPDGALARFVPVTPSTNAPLRAWVTSPGGNSTTLVERAPTGLDVNRMATALMWNSLEGVRQAKSAIGNVLLVGGIAVAATPGSENESDRARTNRALIGAGVAVLGALLKAGSEADTRHCEFLPQRTYIVPMNIETASGTLSLEVEGDPSSRAVLSGVDPPVGTRPQLRYIRLGEAALGWGDASWRTAGRVVYANDAYPWRVPGDELPYIFGGRCVRTPSALTMKHYYEAGHLTWMTSADLANIYREEGVTFEVEEQVGTSASHILEGGTSLVAPLPGTMGFQRLFGREHAAYSPRSEALRGARERQAGMPGRDETLNWPRATREGEAP